MAWVDPHSPEGALKQAQEWYDRCWDDWFSQRTPANEQRLELATARLEEAKHHVKSNSEAKRAWQQKLQAEKDAKKAEDDAKLEAELEPVKDRRRRQWLIDHPDADERVFDQKIWLLIRQDLVEDRHKAMVEAAMERMRRSGRYVL